MAQFQDIIGGDWEKMLGDMLDQEASKPRPAQKPAAQLTAKDLLADFPQPQPPRQPAQPNQQARPQAPGEGMMFPSVAHMGAAAALGGSAQQANHLQGMVGQTMGAIGRENQSRVAQMREHRRMMQEQQLKGMDLQALLIRLQHERAMAEKKMRYDAGMQRYSDDRARGVISSTRWNKMFD